MADETTAVEGDPVEEVTEPVETFTELDPAEAPEGEVTQEWLQERYKQMQGDYTRKTQASAASQKERQEESDFLEALRSDPETQRAVMEQLTELLSEADEGEYEDTAEATNPLESRLAQIENERANERASALGNEIATHIEQLSKDAGVELDDDDLKRVFADATAGERIGKTETAAAFKAFTDRQAAQHDKWQKAYLKGKTAPTQLPGGQSAADTPDLSSHEARVARMAAIMGQ